MFNGKITTGKLKTYQCPRCGPLIFRACQKPSPFDECKMVTAVVQAARGLLTQVGRL
jgi:hypothetical protein